MAETADKRGPAFREVARALGALWAGPVAGAIVIALYAVQAPNWVNGFAAFSGGVMVAGAFGMLGGLVGFLFGIPHTVQQRAGGAQQLPVATGGTGTTAGSGYLPSTNLEQISDWLTKILVGVGLTELKSLPKGLATVADTLAPGLGNLPGSKTFALGLIIYFSVFGFLIGFMWSRLYLASAFEAADVRAIAREEVSLQLARIPGG